MHRILLLLFAGILLTAGCLTANQSPVEAEVVLITPADESPLFGGPATYAGLIGEWTPRLPTNYSLVYVVIPPDNATPLHRLIGAAELVYVLGGTAEIRCDGETMTAREGETVLLPEGVLQSIGSIGDGDLRYLSVVQPPFTPDVEISGDDLAAFGMTPNKMPIVVASPGAETERSLDSGAAVYSLLNPVPMDEAAIPIDYSLAYAELLPDGYLDYDGIRGSSDLLYVIEGEILVTTRDGTAIRVPAGSAAYIPPDVVKETRNAACSTTRLLSFIDPAWTPEKTDLWE